MAARGAVLGAGKGAPPPGLVPSVHSVYLVYLVYRMATGATGVPVAPTKGSGIADSRNV